ncbi:MAG: hypothetical protein QN210_12265 [Armatimonadota bacterium]|nr:hypothetical protein [Armatimonadota bacterium]
MRALIRRLVAEEDGPEAPLTAVQRTALVLKAMETLARLLRAQAALTARPAPQDVTAALAEALRQLGQTPPPAGPDEPAPAAPALPALPAPVTGVSGGPAPGSPGPGAAGPQSTPERPAGGKE